MQLALSEEVLGLLAIDSSFKLIATVGFTSTTKRTVVSEARYDTRASEAHPARCSRN
jgi:hypothetical protein